MSLQCFLGTYEGELFGWHVELDGSSTHKLTCAIKAHDAACRALTLTRRGTSNTLLTSASDGSCKIYDLRASREAGSLIVEADTITVMRACGPDHVITGHEGGFMRLWRISDWSDVLTFRAHKKGAINDIAPHPSARVALSVGRDRSLRLIDLTKGKVIAVQDMGAREPREVRYSPDASVFAVLFDSQVVLHNAATAEPQCNIELPPSIVKFVSYEFLTLPQPVMRSLPAGNTKGSASQAQPETCLAIGCEGGSLLLAGLDGNTLATVETGHAGRVRCIRASHEHLFTVGADAVVHVWLIADLLSSGKRSAPPQPVQKLTAAAGFRGTCLALVFPSKSQTQTPTTGPTATTLDATAPPSSAASATSRSAPKAKVQHKAQLRAAPEPLPAAAEEAAATAAAEAAADAPGTTKKRGRRVAFAAMPPC